MPLETATYVSDLVVSNPVPTDGLAQADDHMRLTKATLKNTFPNFTAVALQSTQAQLDAAVGAVITGSSNLRFYNAGTALLPALTPFGDPDTGLFSPAANQLAWSLGGSQVILMGSGSFVTSLNIASSGVIGAAAVASTGAYSGGTGQLVPIGGTLMWWDDVLPTEGGYAWANGQIIASANTVCPVLLARWGSRFGGNGTTTMGVPDLRDTVPIGQRNMGGVIDRALISHLTVLTCNTVIGTPTNTLIAANVPSLTSSNASQTINVALGSGKFAYSTNGDLTAFSAAGAGGFVSQYSPSNSWALATGLSGNNNIVVSYVNASQTAVNNVQPSTVVNFIIRLA